MQKVRFKVIRGVIELSNGTKIKGEGHTSDPDLIKEIKKLAEDKDALGNPQYVELLDSAAANAEEHGVIKKPEAEPAVQIPPGVPEREFLLIKDALQDVDLDFEQAFKQTDQALSQIKEIGAGRIKIIRAIGQHNGYSEAS